MHLKQLDNEAILEVPSTSDGGERVFRSPSRSPHPYHRRGASLLESEPQTNSIKSWGNGNPIRPSQSSSESGTEADDERGGGFLKRLPAPPLRGRKGVRGATPADRTPAITPLPSPHRYNGLNWDLGFPQRTPSSVVAADPTKREIEYKKAQEKYTKRKRAEILRRMVEVCLFGVIGIAVCNNDVVSIKLPQWRREILSQLLVTAFLCLLYPLRLTYHGFCKTNSGVLQSFVSGFRIPSKFDPGPLLYPVFLPVIVAISLLPRTSDFLLANSILGLSSLPAKMLPRADQHQTWNVIHWIISLIPLVVSRNSFTQLQSTLSFTLKSGQTTNSNLAVEALTLLYPLQHLTTETIYFLTTTSLDPAELQLLSAALINVLLFAVTPQAEILKALTWLGGLGLLITCRKVLSWEVALARVPSWRFRRSSQRQQVQASAKRGLDVLLCQKLVGLGTRGASHGSSGSEDNVGRPSSVRGSRLPKLRLNTEETTNGRGTNSKAASAVEPHVKGEISHAQIGSIPATNFGNHRRHTFSSIGLGDAAQVKTTSSGRARRALSPNSTSFLTLTPAQAQVRRWAYAVFVYMMVGLIILVPIRKYIMIRALSMHEPFGWALGYLLGDNLQFRFWTVSNNLEKWISLPDRLDDMSGPSHLGWIDQLRQDTVGAANTRLLLCAYCIVILAVGIIVVLRLTSVVEVDTRRKVFHGIMVAIFLPTVFLDPCFTALALILILALFLLLDLFRASVLPPISRPLTYFLAPYVDGRDHRGPVIVSHIFLLIGCAIPLWLSLAGAPRSGTTPWVGWDTEVRDLSMVSGVICVGMGDAAASLIGRRFGRHKWLWSGGKSLEGSLAFAVAVTIGLTASYAWLLIGGWIKHDGSTWMIVVAKAITAATGASLTEAVLTSCNDNVIVPIVLWLLVRGLAF